MHSVVPAGLVPTIEVELNFTALKVLGLDFGHFKPPLGLGT